MTILLDCFKGIAIDLEIYVGRGWALFKTCLHFGESLLEEHLSLLCFKRQISLDNIPVNPPRSTAQNHCS